MDLKTIYLGAENLINQLIRKESTAQGHYLTGALEDSLKGKVIKNELQGFAVYYTKFVDEGVPAASASMKQFPFVVRYFQKRGLELKEAKAAAAATIKKWMKEGMSTKASARFSSTGKRQEFVFDAFEKGNTELDSYMGSSFDKAIDEKYLLEKSETI